MHNSLPVTAQEQGVSKRLTRKASDVRGPLESGNRQLTTSNRIFSAENVSCDRPLRNGSRPVRRENREFRQFPSTGLFQKLTFFSVALILPRLTEQLVAYLPSKRSQSEPEPLARPGK